MSSKDLKVDTMHNFRFIFLAILSRVSQKLKDNVDDLVSIEPVELFQKLFLWERFMDLLMEAFNRRLTYKREVPCDKDEMSWAISAVFGCAF